MKIFIISMFTFVLLISGCQDTTTSIAQKKDPPVMDQKDTNWIPSSTFQSNDQSEMIGISQKLGIICSENAFIEKETTKCLWHFWGDPLQIGNSSLQVKAVHKDTSETELLIDSILSSTSANRGADVSQPSNITFPKSGLWRMDVYMDGKLFGSIVVNVKKNTSP